MESAEDTLEAQLWQAELRAAAAETRADRLEKTIRSIIARAVYWKRGDIGQAYIAGRASAWGDIHDAAQEGIRWSRGEDD